MLDYCWFIGIVVGYFLLRKYIQGGRYEKPTRCDGKVVLITGANSGIGKATALELAKRGGKIYLACRSMEKGTKAIEEIKKATNNQNVFLMTLDLASFKSIHSFAERFIKEVNKLDILINNAGVFFCPRSFTEDWLETNMGVSHYGHFLLTNLLLDLIKTSDEGRILNVSSSMHHFGKIDKKNLNAEKSYNRLKAYCNSKLAAIMFTKELAKRLVGTNVATYALHPGLVYTGIYRPTNIIIATLNKYVFPLFEFLFFKTAESGCQTYLYCAMDPDLRKESGKYYQDCKEYPVSKYVDDDELTAWLYKHSYKITGLSEKSE